MCHSTIGDIGAGLCIKEKEHESEEETFVFLSAEKSMAMPRGRAPATESATGADEPSIRSGLLAR